MTAAPMTAAAYRGVAPRGCAASSFRITLKTLESATARRNAQNVLIAVSTGDASGGIRYLGSPIGVRTPTRGLAWEGEDRNAIPKLPTLFGLAHRFSPDSKGSPRSAVGRSRDRRARHR